jgi:hypothetical protein
MCGRLGVADPEGLGKQIAILVQGALLMSQVCRNPAPFASAKAAVETLLQSAKR